MAWLANLAMLVILGLVASVVMGLGVESRLLTLAGAGAAEATRLDGASLLAGVLLGLLLSSLLRTRWSELPARMQAWLGANASTFGLMGWGVVAVVVLALY